MPKDTLIKRAKLQEKAPLNQVQFKKARKMCYLNMLITSVIIREGGGGGLGYSSEFLVGVCRPVIQSLPYFR